MYTQFANETAIRDQVLKNVSITIALFVLAVAATNLFITQNYILGLMEVIISLLFVHVYFRVNRSQKLTWQPIAVAATVTIGLLYGFIHTKENSAIVMWVFTLPALYQLLFNRFIGSIATFSMLAATTYIYFPKLLEPDHYPNAFLNFSLPYCMIWVIAYHHETIRILIQERLEALAKTDTLTNAYNRLALTQDTQPLFTQSSNYYLFHFDLDHFKQVNDTYGHSTGDLVLKDTCKTVSELIGEGTLYRVGGEEFCVVFEATDIEMALKQANTIRNEVSQIQFEFDTHQFSISISGGLTGFSKNERGVDSLLCVTDKALYKAKSNGRNRIELG